MKHNLKEIIKQTDNKYLNIYQANFDNDTQYYIASRRDYDQLSVNVVEDKIDAVRILPYYFDGGNIKVVVINEFRYAVNRYVCAVPAGIVDGDEKPIEAAKRELKEEIGAEVINLQVKEVSGYMSPGMSDEKASTFWAEIVLDDKQKLDKSEDITYEVIDFDEIPKILSTRDFDLFSQLQLKGFYYEIKYNILKNK